MNMNGLGCGKERSGKCSLLEGACAPLPPRNPLELALDRAGTGKQAAIHLIEFVAGCVKHEAARNSHCDPYGAAIELDRETLCNHRTFLPASAPSAAQAFAPRLRAARLIEWKGTS
jgi:hypothetical protein